MELSEEQIEYLSGELISIDIQNFSKYLIFALENATIDFDKQEILKMDEIELLKLVDLDACERCGITFPLEDKVWNNDGEGICESCASNGK